MAGQQHDVTPETWDSLIPHILQNMSPAGREYLHRATQPAHLTSQFFSIDAGELEGWTLQFLASLADDPSWENTVSLVNEHHQTLAHLAVLFQYTALLKKVAQWGIDVDVQDVNGFTALHCAYLCGDLDSVGILKGYGADEDIQDNLGRRPLDMYTLSTSDPGRGSPSSDRTSSSAQRPTAGEEDYETVSMASSQPSSFSSHEATMDLPAGRHQPLRMHEPTTNSSVIPASVSMPSLASGNVTDDGKRIKGHSRLNLSDSSISLVHTPSSSHVLNVPVATFRFARSQEQELKEPKKTSNEPTLQCNQDMQSPSSLQGTIFKPRGNSPSEGGDQANPGEYQWCKNDCINPIYRIKLVSAYLFTRYFLLYLDPKAPGGPSLSLSPPAKHTSGIHEQISHPRSIMSFPQLALPALGAEIQGAFPVPAGTEHRTLASVIERYSNKEEMDVDSPEPGGGGQPQAYLFNRPASYPSQVP